MAVEVLKPKPKMVSPYSVKGYRPEGMDIPIGPVLKIGPRRPAGGYQSDTPTKTPGAIVKDHTSVQTVIPAVQRRRRLATVTPVDRLGRPGRVIIPNNGISLPNSNRV